MLKQAVGIVVAGAVFLFGYLEWGTDALEKAQVVTRAAELLARPDLCLEISEGTGFFDSTLTREACQAKARRSGDMPEEAFREFLKNYGLETRFGHFQSLVEVQERKSDWEPPVASSGGAAGATPGPEAGATPGPSATPGPEAGATPGPSATPGPEAGATPEPSGVPEIAAQPSPVPSRVTSLPLTPEGEKAYSNWQRMEFVHCEVDTGSLARHLKENFDIVISVYWGKPSPRSCSIGGFIGLPRADTPFALRAPGEGGVQPFTPGAALHSRGAGLQAFYPKVDFLLDCPQLRFGFRKDFCHLRAATFRRGTFLERKAHCLSIGADDLRIFCQNLAAEAGDRPHPSF